MKSDQKQINFNQAIELQGKSQLKLVMPALGTYQKIVPGNWLLFHINTCENIKTGKILTF